MSKNTQKLSLSERIALARSAITELDADISRAYCLTLAVRDSIVNDVTEACAIRLLEVLDERLSNRHPLSFILNYLPEETNCEE